MGGETKQITIRLPAEEYAAVVAIAEAETRNLTYQIRKFIAEGISRAQSGTPPAPRAGQEPSDQEHPPGTS